MATPSTEQIQASLEVFIAALNKLEDACIALGNSGMETAMMPPVHAARRVVLNHVEALILLGRTAGR